VEDGGARGGSIEGENAVMNDELFGELTWDRIEHAWLGKTRLADLLDFGAALPDSPEGFIRDDFDPQKLFHEGVFRLVVRPGGGGLQAPPTDEQRQAWQQFLDDRGRIIEEIMKRALQAYVRQRPARIHWWTVMYGADDPMLPLALPEIHTVDELRALVRPFRFVLFEPRDNRPPPAWIAIQFDAAWDRGTGFVALLRDAQIVEFGPPELAEKLPNTDPLIDVPPFGKLRCYKGTNWSGLVHFEPFARMERVVTDRDQHAMFRRHPVFRPALHWNFVDGDFELEMVSPDAGEVAAQQIDAFNAFMRDPQRTAGVVLDAILAYYRQVFDVYHEGYADEDEVNRLMPTIESTEGLRDLITFQTMMISTPLDEAESAFVGLGFACSWDEEHGLYVRWRDGQVEEVGFVETIL